MRLRDYRARQSFRLMGLRKIIEKLDTVVLNLDEKGLLAVLKADEEINIKDMADLISKSLLSGL